MNVFKDLGKIYKISFVQSIFKLSVSHVLLLFLPLAVTPILSRLYSPEDYGAWGVFSSVFYIVSSFLFLSYENTIVKTNKEQEIPSLVSLSLIVSFIIITITIFVFVLGKRMGISFFYTFPNIGLLILLLVITALCKVADSLANRWKKYGTMSIASIINGGTQALMRIFLGLCPLVSYGLIVGNVIAQLIATLFVIFNVRKLIKQIVCKDVNSNQIVDAAIKYKKFPLYDAPARFIELSIANFALILLSLFWNKDDVGAFSMISQFLLIPISIIGSAVSTVYYKEISEMKNNEGWIKETTRRCAKITFVISLAPLLFLVLGGDQLLVLFLGEKWIESGKMSLCLAVFSVPVILSEPLLPIFRALDKQEMRFKINFLCLVLTESSLLLSAILFDNIYISLLFFSVLYALCRFLMYFIILKLAHVKIDMVSKYFYPVLFLIYGLLIVRLTSTL